MVSIFALVLAAYLFAQSAAAPYAERVWSDSFSLDSKSSASDYERIVDGLIRNNRVFMITGSTCLHSQEAKRILDTDYPDVSYKFLDADITPGADYLMGPVSQRSGTLGLPVIFVCGSYLGGAPRLDYLHRTKALRPMLSQC